MSESSLYGVRKQMSFSSGHLILKKKNDQERIPRQQHKIAYEERGDGCLTKRGYQVSVLLVIDHSSNKNEQRKNHGPTTATCE
jgi:hypothetical protein